MYTLIYNIILQYIITRARIKLKIQKQNDGKIRAVCCSNLLNSCYIETVLSVSIFAFFVFSERTRIKNQSVYQRGKNLFCPSYDLTRTIACLAILHLHLDT